MIKGGSVRYAELRGTPTPLEGRLGVRALSADALVQAFRATVALYFVAGVLTGALAIVGSDDFEHPRLVYVIAPVCLVVGSVLLLLLRLAIEWAIERVEYFVHVILLVTGVLISAGLFGAGPKMFMIGTVVYLQPLIFSCYLLRTQVAFVHISFIAVAFAVVLANSAPVSHPVLQWAFLVGIGATGALILSRLADSATASAISEYTARTQLAVANDTLEQRVAEQVDELERLGRLRRFLAAPVADAISGDSSELLAPHRRAIAVFFCDLRGFTSFSASAEPEDVVEVLGEYYRTMGRHLDNHKATFGSFAGDGIMAYFGDPLPLDNPTEAALAMSLEAATALDSLVDRWHHNGYDLNYGIGITHGYATLGVVGYDARSEYTALGSVVNLAARLSDQAAGGQILLDGRAASKLGETHQIRSDGDRVLKGMGQPVAVFEALR